MKKGWEHFFYFFTFITQGSSFLNPRAYAIIHRMHHAYSDTEKDPHSPYFIKDLWGLMLQTKDIYRQYVLKKIEPEPAFKDLYPLWPFIDKLSDKWVTRVTFAGVYIAFYLHFVPVGAEWMFLLLPVHFFMGPIHGAIVNWCGHKYGYENYDNKDHSKNTLPVDFLMMGELFQNNHHKSPNSPNFARKWFEFDPGYYIVRSLNLLGIIRLRKT